MFHHRRTERPRQTAHRRQLLRRLLPIENLETRSLLSGISLADFSSTAYDSMGHYHEDMHGNTYHVLPTPIEQAGTPTGDLSGPSAAANLADTFLLHSNPGASQTIYLDFDGEVTTGTIWNSIFNGGADIVTPAYNFSGDGSFTDSELARVQAIWRRVAEDFVPFDVDVTTEEPSFDALSKSGTNDSTWGVRVVVGGGGSWFGNGGGVAYVGSFNWNSDTPVFVFEDRLGNGNEKYTAEAISHEAGHSLGLNHDGRTSPTEEYYQGSGSGATGWAPIMGVGYYKELTQWSRGEYNNPSNTQDDLAVITSYNGFGYRTDDHSDDLSSATALSISQGIVSGSGIIERNDDIDLFSFFTEGGEASLDFNPLAQGSNLDIAAALLDAAGTLIVSSNPIGTLAASISATLAAGQYFVQVTGVGQGDPAAGGYSDYGSLGQYWISGSIVSASASDDNFTVAEDSGVTVSWTCWPTTWPTRAQR